MCPFSIFQRPMTGGRLFRDRADAARQLAVALAAYRGKHPLVLAIPRGAVPMGRIIADELGGDLDVVLVRKLGAPFNPEFAVGAIAESGWAHITDHAASAGADAAYLQAEKQTQLEKLRARRKHVHAGACAARSRGPHRHRRRRRARHRRDHDRCAARRAIEQAVAARVRGSRRSARQRPPRRATRRRDRMPAHAGGFLRRRPVLFRVLAGRGRGSCRAAQGD